MTDYNPIYRSPITVPDASTVSGLRLQDLTGVQITRSEGEVAEALQKHFSTIPATPGEITDVDAGFLACLTPTEFYLFGKSTEVQLPSDSELEAGYTAAGSFAHTTDATHGQAALKLSGADAVEALSKICGLDFHDSAFPNMKVKQTSAARIKTLIARIDEDGEPAYHLHVSRPFGQYFWNILWDAGQEFDIGVG